MSIPLVLVERYFWSADLLKLLGVEAIRSLLSVVATGAMTALSLACSLTPGAFILAASSIGPRLWPPI